MNSSKTLLLSLVDIFWLDAWQVHDAHPAVNCTASMTNLGFETVDLGEKKV